MKLNFLLMTTHLGFLVIGTVRKIRNASGGWVSSFLLRLRNANEKIENTLIDIAIPKTIGAIGALKFPSA